MFVALLSIEIRAGVGIIKVFLSYCCADSFSYHPVGKQYFFSAVFSHSFRYQAKKYLFVLLDNSFNTFFINYGSFQINYHYLKFVLKRFAYLISIYY